jgi:hypothetical protein
MILLTELARREHVVGVAAYQSNRTNNNHQNDGQHYRVFSDILTLFIVPTDVKKLVHLCLSPRAQHMAKISAAFFQLGIRLESGELSVQIASPLTVPSGETL